MRQSNSTIDSIPSQYTDATESHVSILGGRITQSGPRDPKWTEYEKTSTLFLRSVEFSFASQEAKPHVSKLVNFLDQIYINAFPPWIASELNSNMDLHNTLDPYLCASYIVDYVNKSNSGMSHLHRELLRIYDGNPEFDQARLLTEVGPKVLRNVEMSAHEVGWYLLRQPMSWASRATVAIPTMIPLRFCKLRTDSANKGLEIPQERYKVRKRSSTMDAENLAGCSTVKSLLLTKILPSPNARLHLVNFTCKLIIWNQFYFRFET